MGGKLPIAGVVGLKSHNGIKEGANTTWLGRSPTALVAWTEGPDPIEVETAHDYLAVLPDGGGSIEAGGATAKAGPRSVIVVPAGKSAIRLDGPGRCIRIFAPAPAKWAEAANDFSTDGLPLLQGFEPAFSRRPGAETIAIYALDQLPNSQPRAKLFQSGTVSISVVEYTGPRAKSELSPHSHTDFEQLALAVDGTWTQHFRTPWLSDANHWADDQHIDCGPGDLAVIPPPIIHTTEGTGAGRNLMVEIFAPPRRDFIAKGTMINAGDYIDPRG